MAVRRRKVESDNQQNNRPPESEYSEDLIADNPEDKPYIAVFVLVGVARVLLASDGIINDCDEVYNYWEPLHLFLHGEGFQTWEYSPIYAIRSYFYIYLHYVPASFFQMLGADKIAVFTSLRLLLGFFCLGGELYAYNAIFKKFNIRTARLFLFFTICSSGIFLASTAFVPSSFCMAITFYILGAYLNENWRFGIFCVAFSTLVGWPFSAVIGLPFVVHTMFLKNLRRLFVTTSIVAGMSIGLVQFLTDSYYFGKSVVAPLNIVLYNVLSGPGPSLYGEEPIMYYMKNLFLNWNLVIFAALAASPFSLCAAWIAFREERLTALCDRWASSILLAATAVSWMVIFGAQAHKEERFLFPVYPFVAFFAALSCVHVHQHYLCRIPSTRLVTLITYLFLLCFAALSVSRSYAVMRNYRAHVDVYTSLNKELLFHELPNKDEVRVCVGKEWHRFPSSFFIPETDHIGRKVSLNFLQSEFRGLLPKPFKSGFCLIDSTRHEPIGMNNLNKEEVSRYVSLNSCDYVIDVDMEATEREPDFREMSASWKSVVSKPFIDVSRSTKFGGLVRAFYVPYLSDRFNVMTTYTLYRKIIY